MSEERGLFWKSAANHGLIMGLMLTLMAVVIWLSKLESAGFLRLANYALVVFLVYRFMKIRRDTHLGGYISYSKAFRYGMAVMFLASIVFSFYNIIYMNYLNPDSVQQSLDLLEETYYESGFSEDQIEQLLTVAEGLQTPVFQAFSVVLGTCFMGLIVTLIVALFVRREGDPFQQAMKYVPDAEVVDEHSKSE